MSLAYNFETIGSNDLLGLRPGREASHIRVTTTSHISQNKMGNIAATVFVIQDCKTCLTSSNINITSSHITAIFMAAYGNYQ